MASKSLIINGLIILVAMGTVYLLNHTFTETPPPTPVTPTAITIGSKAPDFKGKDSNGKDQSLSQYQGKTIVLEWKNHLCPFVKKHYIQNTMQQLQKDHTRNGGIWLSIISSAPGKQGHVSPSECNAIIQAEQSAATAVILDSSGEIGRLYQAKTTPDMVIIGPDGTIQYKGAIDSIRSTSSDDIKTAVPYVRQALTAIQSNTAVSPAQTVPYGCSIKY